MGEMREGRRRGHERLGKRREGIEEDERGESGGEWRRYKERRGRQEMRGD